MKWLSELQLSTPLRVALQAAHRRITSEFRVDRLVLFGSLVRGESDEESDADLLIVLAEPPTHQVRDPDSWFWTVGFTSRPNPGIKPTS
jgi:hypothetical protein